MWAWSPHRRHLQSLSGVDIQAKNRYVSSIPKLRLTIIVHRLGLVLLLVCLCCSVAVLPGCTPKNDPKAKLSLTETERQWLAQHPILRIAPDPSFPPIEWIAEDGSYHGLIADYFTLLEDRIGCKFQVVPQKTWSGVLAAAQRRDIDIVTAAQQTPERLTYLNFTSPLVDIPNVIIVSMDSVQDLAFSNMGGMRVAVTEGNALHEYMKNGFPEIIIVPVPSDLVALQEVSFHRVDATVVNLAIASYLIKMNGFVNLKIVGGAHRSDALHIATRTDWPILNTIMEKGIASISEQERTDLSSRWIMLPMEPHRLRLIYLYIGAGIVLSILLGGSIVIIWNRLLRRRVETKTVELNRELAEHRRMDQALRESEGRWQFALEAAGDGIWDLDLQKREAFVSERWVELLGYTPCAADAAVETWLARIPLEDHALVRSALARHLAGESEFTTVEIRFLCADGSHKWVLIRGKLIERDADGKPLRMLGVFTDITYSRQAREAITAAEEKYHAIFNNSTEGIFQSTLTGEFLTVNQAAARIFGYDSPEQFLSAGKNASGCYLQKERRNELHRLIAELGSVENWESEVFTKDGSIIWITENTHLVQGGEGNASYYEGTIQDITQRKRAEESLRASEDKFSKAFRISPDAINISRLSDGVFLEANEGFARLTGYAAEEVIGKSSFDIHMWADESDRDKLIAALQQQGFANNLEAHFRLRDGSIRVGLMSARLIEVGGEPCILSMTRDLTERVLAEREIIMLAQSLRSVGESVSITDMNDRLLFVNRAFVELYGYAENELIGHTIDIVRSPHDHKEMVEKILPSSLTGGWQGEVINRKKDGTEFPVFLSTSLVRDKQGEPLALIGVARDITEARKVRDQINASLKEKEILLKEIHHRVKNNLQVISSLLNLQLASVRDPYDVALFQESQNRIRSMAIIHEKLYQSDDLSHVDFGSYIGTLTSSLFRSYDVSDIGFQIDVESIRLSIDAAIPCGLILNELVSNALKHAFPDGRRGYVSIAMHREEGHFCRLVVADDGIGFPAGIDFRKTPSLGLELVNTLVNQLNGSIELTSGNGSKFTIRFPQQ